MFAQTKLSGLNARFRRFAPFKFQISSSIWRISENPGYFRLRKHSNTYKWCLICKMIMIKMITNTNFLIILFVHTDAKCLILLMLLKCFKIYLYFTIHEYTLSQFNLFYLILFILLYFTLLYFTLLYFTLLYFTLLYFTLLYFPTFIFLIF